MDFTGRPNCNLHKGKNNCGCKLTLLILVGYDQHVHIIHNHKTHTCHELQWYITQPFNKIDNPKVIINRIIIKIKESDGAESQFCQYFFLTKENKV